LHGPLPPAADEIKSLGRMFAALQRSCTGEQVDDLAPPHRTVMIRPHFMRHYRGKTIIEPHARFEPLLLHRSMCQRRRQLEREHPLTIPFWDSRWAEISCGGEPRPTER
jgi:hypothetical protein